MNLQLKAVQGIITPEMEKVALKEGVQPEIIRQRVAEGTVVIPCNPNHKNLEPVGIGNGLRTKVSASIGLHSRNAQMEEEKEKIRVALAAGTDAIMDLSAGGDVDAMRKETLALANVPVGTLPLYQAMAEAAQKRGSSLNMDVEELFEVIERQAADGVDFLTLHCGTTMDIVERAKREGRIDPLVSYGGSHLIGWMVHNRRENPLYEQYDRVLALAAKYNATLSLADGMRPGCLADSLDGAQVHEMVVLGELVQRARKAGVQIMVKGPGHMPLNHVQATVELQKSLCKGAPYFVFGPLLTDIAPGFDHINAAIGGALSTWAGAEFLCYVTPAEHIGLPTVEQVREGVYAARIAAHAGDLAKERVEDYQWDLKMSIARKKLDWEGQLKMAIDPERALHIRKTRNSGEATACAMCGKYCAMEIVAKYLDIEKHSC
ncbi:MAG TPA: phosphomethylpyrimidine synthase ThiC [Bacillota bacterium]|nr:phosphomethylpyrimidine synthase ThiC [Bacillota bacterium]